MIAVGSQRAFRETSELAGFITVVDKDKMTGRQHVSDSLDPFTYLETRFQAAASRDRRAELLGIVQDSRGSAPRRESKPSTMLVNEQFQPFVVSFLHQVNRECIEEFVCKHEPRPVLRKRRSVPIIRAVAERLQRIRHLAAPCPEFEYFERTRRTRAFRELFNKRRHQLTEDGL